MSIRTNIQGSVFIINTDSSEYFVQDTYGVKRGDLLHINGDKVTGYIGENSVDAIAKQDGEYNEKIKCYVLQYSDYYRNFHDNFTYSSSTPIRTNAVSHELELRSEIETYVVNDSSGVERGDLLHLAGDVVSRLSDGESIDAVAIRTANDGENVKCYVLKYRTRYKDMNELLPYIVLVQFTYHELETMVIRNHISNKCETVSTARCDIVSRYNCDNLNTYGTRINNK